MWGPRVCVQVIRTPDFWRSFLTFPPFLRKIRLIQDAAGKSGAKRIKKFQKKWYINWEIYKLRLIKHVLDLRSEWESASPQEQDACVSMLTVGIVMVTNVWYKDVYSCTNQLFRSGCVRRPAEALNLLPPRQRITQQAGELFTVGVRTCRRDGA